MGKGKQDYKFFVLAGFLGVLFLLTRLVNLTLLPIFTDEAIYIRWAQIAKNDAAWRFISLTDGKQPLFVWMVMVMLKFVPDPLTAGRLSSVLGGLAGCLGLGLLTFQLFNNKTTAFFASFLWIVSPFTLVYDRLALYDSWTAALAVWSLYFQLRLAEKPDLGNAYSVAIAMGLAILNKTSGFFTLYLFPVVLLLKGFKSKKRLSGKLLLFSIFSVGISLIMYNLLRLSPWFHMIGQKDLTFIWSLSEWLEHPFRDFWGNLKNGLWPWVYEYLTLPVLVLIGAGLFIKKSEFVREKLILLAWFTAPFTALAVFGKVLYPRFILFMTAPLLSFAAYGAFCLIDKIKHALGDNKFRWNFSLWLAGLVFLSVLFYFDYLIILKPREAPLPQADRYQLLDAWPSGYGVREVIDFINKESQKGPVFLGTEGTFGLFPAAFEMYFWENPKIEVKGFWPIISDTQRVVEEKLAEKTVYFVQKESQEPYANWSMEEVLKIKRGKGETFLKLYRILPTNKSF